MKRVVLSIVFIMLGVFCFSDYIQNIEIQPAGTSIVTSSHSTVVTTTGEAPQVGDPVNGGEITSVSSPTPTGGTGSSGWEYTYTVNTTVPTLALTEYIRILGVENSDSLIAAIDQITNQTVNAVNQAGDDILAILGAFNSFSGNLQTAINNVLGIIAVQNN